jgi:hypothetical protein
MNSQNNHHFIPAFLMREWEGGVDGKLSAMRWRRGQVVQDRYKAKSVAKQRHLYAIEKSGPEPNQALEREFMTKMIDDPAALVHAAIVARGLDCLTEAQQYTWTRFLVSLVLRGPEAVEYVRARAIAALIEQLEADPGAFAEERAVVSAPTLRSYIEQQHPDVLNDFGHRALPTLIQTSGLNKLIFEAHWMTRRLSKQTRRLLIGDRPLALEGAVAAEFLLYLPVAPDLAFLAYNSPATAGRIRAMGEPLFVRYVNRLMVEQASTYVYGVDDDHRPLLESRLARAPAGQGLGFGPRAPLKA